jgi:hypothetical protein
MVVEWSPTWVGAPHTAYYHDASKDLQKSKTYNSGDSRALTDRNTNPPVHCLYMAERTGSLVVSVLWSYVKNLAYQYVYVLLTTRYADLS